MENTKSTEDDFICRNILNVSVFKFSSGRVSYLMKVSKYSISVGSVLFQIFVM